MDFLDKQFYGNTVSEWAIALGIILGSFIAVKICYWVIANIISRITQKTKTRVDDVLIEKLEKPIVYLLIILGYWVSIHYLHFEEEVLTFLEHLAYFALVITIY